MSHTMNIKLEIRDFEALKSACKRLGYQYLGKGNFRLHEGNESGVGIQMPGMKYPVVVKENGSVSMDNYDWNGITGRRGARFDHSIIAPLEATYGLEKSISEATAKGYLLQETEEETDLVLRITIPD